MILGSRWSARRARVAGVGRFLRRISPALARASGHFQVGYFLGRPVHRGADARVKPLAYLARVSEFYRAALHADPAPFARALNPRSSPRAAPPRARQSGVPCRPMAVVSGVSDGGRGGGGARFPTRGEIVAGGVRARPAWVEQASHPRPIARLCDTCDTRHNFGVLDKRALPASSFWRL